MIGTGTDEEAPSPEDSGEVPGTGLIEADPTSLDFDTIPALTETTETIELTNTGDAEITITELTSTHASIFSTDTDPPVPITMTAGGSVDLDVTFSPPSEGDHEAIIDVKTDTIGTDIQIPVSGTADEPDCEVCAPRLEVMTSSGTSDSLELLPAFFVGCTANGTLTLSNTGDMDLEITGVNVMNNWIDLFWEGNFSASWTGPLSIGPGSSTVVAIDYVTDAPASEASDLATDQNVVHILSNDPSRPDWVIGLSANVIFCG